MGGTTSAGCARRRGGARQPRRTRGRGGGPTRPAALRPPAANEAAHPPNVAKKKKEKKKKGVHTGTLAGPVVETGARWGGRVDARWGGWVDARWVGRGGFFCWKRAPHFPSRINRSGVSPTSRWVCPSGQCHSPFHWVRASTPPAHWQLCETWRTAGRACGRRVRLVAHPPAAARGRVGALPDHRGSTPCSCWHLGARSGRAPMTQPAYFALSTRATTHAVRGERAGPRPHPPGTRRPPRRPPLPHGRLARVASRRTRLRVAGNRRLTRLSPTTPPLPATASCPPHPSLLPPTFAMPTFRRRQPRRAPPRLRASRPWAASAPMAAPAPLRGPSTLSLSGGITRRCGVQSTRRRPPPRRRRPR